MKFPINVTLDSNIFIKKHFGFDKNTFYTTLEEYIANGFIKLYLSDIVVQEVKSHYIEEIKGTLQKVSDKIYNLRANAPDSINNLLNFPDICPVTDDFISASFDDFLKRLRTEIMSCDNIKISDIFHDYFNTIPPFENNVKKKSEFPDSVIFHEIQENFSPDNPVYVVSNDNGLKQALLTINEYCTVFPDETFLFDFISQHQTEYSKLKNLIESNISNLHSNVLCIIKNNITLYSYEYDTPIMIPFDNVITKILPSDHSDIKIIQFDENKVLASIKLKLSINLGIYKSSNLQIQTHLTYATCNFSFDCNNHSFSDLSIHVSIDDNTLQSKKNETLYCYTICPDCGEEIHQFNDGGNGFCVNCASEH